MTNEQPYGILYADGTLQVESDDRKLRIILSHIIVIDEVEKAETYRSKYFVKDGIEWQQTTYSTNYSSVERFIEAIRNADDFTLAIRDIDEQKKNEGPAGSRNVSL